MITEKYLEKKLTEGLHALGVWCEKYTNPFKAGYPDRICIEKTGKVSWVEVKTPGEKLRPLQEERKRELECYGCPVYVVDSEEALRSVLGRFSQTESEPHNVESDDNKSHAPRRKVKVYLSVRPSAVDPRFTPQFFRAIEQVVKSIRRVKPISPLRSTHQGISPWYEHMLVNLRLLSDCDAVLMHKDQDDIVDCRIEKLFAERIGIPVFTDLEELRKYVKKLTD